eukprot:Platyproteum_vivax@DN7655_c0_g1_i7.p1
MQASCKYLPVSCVSLAVDGLCCCTFVKPVMKISLSKPLKKFVSNVTGQMAASELMQAGYWANHIPHTVHFYDGIKTVLERASHIVEVGPNPVLIGLKKTCPRHVGKEVQWLPTITSQETTVKNVDVIVSPVVPQKSQEVW